MSTINSRFKDFNTLPANVGDAVTLDLPPRIVDQPGLGLVVSSCKACNGTKKRRGQGWMIVDCDKCGGLGVIYEPEKKTNGEQDNIAHSKKRRRQKKVDKSAASSDKTVGSNQREEGAVGTGEPYLPTGKKGTQDYYEI